MKIIVLLSGGLDSATCLGMAVEQVGKENVIALNIFYGQKHEKEADCARKLASYYGVKYLEQDVSNIMRFSNCALLTHSSEDIKDGTYKEQKQSDSINTYVPFRNGLFLSIATSLALALNCDRVMYGAHTDDVSESAYPDCSWDFVKSMNEAMLEGSGGKVSLYTPFIQNNKAEVVKEGIRLKVPYELTWSCYKGGEKPCGNCATCLERKKAFSENGLIDPAL